MQAVRSKAARRVLADRDGFTSLLNKCRNKKELEDVVEDLSRTSFSKDEDLATIQLQKYIKFGCVQEARSVFDQMKQPDGECWNDMIRAYALKGHMQEAVRLFSSMERPSPFLWVVMVTAAAEQGHLKEAKDMFDRMPNKKLVCWNAMISANARYGDRTEAFELFSKMNQEGLHPNRRAFVAALDSCNRLSQGRSLESHLVEAGLCAYAPVATMLIVMYGRVRSIENAKRVFDATPMKDQILWGVMLRAFCKNRFLDQASICFHKAPAHDLRFVTIFMTALGGAGQLDAAKNAFDDMPERDDRCQNTMVVAYAQRGHMKQARELFDSMRDRHFVSWNVMITGYAQNGYGREALDLLQLMDIEGAQPTVKTLSSIFDACAALGLFSQGKIVHSSFLDSGIESDVVLDTSLVNMYGRCGGLEQARALFDQMPDKNILTWTSMIAAYAQNGHGKTAIDLFHLMELDGVEVDDIIFKNVIYACGQTGYARRSLDYFRLMLGDHEIEPRVEHYKLIIDLLGRAGKLDEAEDLLMNMPFQPDTIAWTNLLSACRLHGDAKRASRTAELAVQTEPEHGGSYVLLASCQRSARDSQCS